MIDLKTLKKTVKKESPEADYLNDNQKEYLDSIEEGIKEAYRIGCEYYSFNTDEDLYDSNQLKKELKSLGYKVELHKEKYMPARMVIKFDD